MAALVADTLPADTLGIPDRLGMPSLWIGAALRDAAKIGEHRA